MTSYSDSWRNVSKNWASYWHRYGGLQDLLKSPYLSLSVALTVVSIYWGGDKEWYSTSLAVIPSLLGFSIGGFAILLVFSSDRFLNVIAEGGLENSLFLSASVAFVHFIVVQVVSLVLAMLGHAGVPFASTLSIFGLYYSLMTALAASFVLFDIAQVYNTAAGVTRDDDDNLPPLVERTSNPDADIKRRRA